MWSWAATSASSATQCPSTATPLWPGTRSSPTAKPSSRSSGVHRQFPLPCKAIKIPLDNRGHNSTIHICMQSPNTKPSGPCLWASPYCQDTCSLRLPMCDYHGSLHQMFLAWLCLDQSRQSSMCGWGMQGLWWARGQAEGAADVAGGGLGRRQVPGDGGRTDGWSDPAHRRGGKGDSASHASPRKIPLDCWLAMPCALACLVMS